jgi:hypothetical protein
VTNKEIALKYLEYLENGEFDELLELFTPAAMVNSPLYGSKPAIQFYRLLSADTNNSILKLKGIFEDDHGQLALYFNYHWTMKNHQTVEFDVVDIIKFNEQNQIVDLTIIYDTVKSRSTD